ncbi:CGNR zinc finger domain-containing protein [Leifsonia sp. Root227]|uniref:CGNR zinc finger domain-containing protein n=1 Tax=Leifsonia sp. Root227 TaxID=1736496 RepID=UPI000ACB31D7|nr:CGNR zinc finger domain-containing protein [Leifsonia sp. Root227]
MAIAAILTNGTGQWMDSADGQHFWFDSGALALDFSYTGGLDQDGGEWQTVHDAKELNDWLTARFPEVAPTAGDREFRDAAALGSAIGRLARQQSIGETLRPEDVDVVNLFVATPDIPPVLAGGGRQAGRTNARPHQALATVARDAVRLFSAEADGRIRECSAEDCDLVYLDTSRSGNRRWCSMQRCGNRAKVRAHRARAAAAAPAP